jgi:prepilin-type N-terminal cleavage/methylation domain-containing protein
MRALRDARGFTLAELLVVMAVTGLVLAGAFALQQQGTVLERMVRELRSAQSVTALGGPGDITFVHENGNTVRYQLSGNMLNRTEGGAPAALVGGVQTLTLTYFSAFDAATNTGTVTAVPGSVKVIRIQIVTGTERPASAGLPGDQRATVESTVALRNA